LQNLILIKIAKTSLFIHLFSYKFSVRFCISDVDLFVAIISWNL